MRCDAGIHILEESNEIAESTFGKYMIASVITVSPGINLAWSFHMGSNMTFLT